MARLSLTIRLGSVGDKLARLHPEDMKMLGVEPGHSIVVESGGSRAAFLAWPTEPDTEKRIVTVNRLAARALGVRDGDRVLVEAYPATPASRVVAAPLQSRPAPPSGERLGEWLRGKPVALGERLIHPRHPLAPLVVVGSEPMAPVVLVDNSTVVEVSRYTVARRVWATRKLPLWNLACRGEHLGEALVLGVEPGPCGWVTRNTEVVEVTREWIIRRLAAAGRLEEALRSLEGGYPPLPDLIILLLLYEHLPR